MQPPSDQQKLEQARAFLQQQRYDQARPILESMPNNPTAREWLNFLNQNQQQMPPPGGQPAYAPPPPPAAPINLPPDLPLAFRQEMKWGIAGLGGILALIILFLFFITPLIDLNNFDSYVDAYQDAVEYESKNARDSYDRDDARRTLDEMELVRDGDYDGVDAPSYSDVDVSAWEIWIGKSSALAVDDRDLPYDGNFTLSGSEIENAYRDLEVAYDDSDVRDILDDFGGFSNVRAIDRLLIIYPIGAILIAAIGLLSAMNIVQTRPALITMAVTLLVLFVFVFVWQSASTSNWRGTIEKQIDREIEDVYEWEERAAIRAYNQIALDEGASYVEKAYNTGGLKLFTGLGLLFTVGILIFVWTSERQHPQIAGQFRQIQAQQKAQRAYQKQQQQPYMQQPYGAPPPQQMPPQQPPMQQPPPASPQTPPPSPTPPPASNDDWTTPQS